MKFLYTFGLNEDGQCGQREQKDKVLYPSLVKLSPFVEFVAISAGSRHTLALTATGDVYSWGWGHVGQLGHGDLYNLPFPRRIESLSRIKSVSAGGMHSACVDEDGLCYTWGSNTYGQLGVGKRTFSYEQEALSRNPRNADALAHHTTHAHNSHNVPHHTNHSQHAHNTQHSYNAHHRGNNHHTHTHTHTHHQSPPLVTACCLPQLVMDPLSVSAQGEEGECPSPLRLQRVACGGMHTAAIDAHGDLYCWGKADNGQIGFSEWYLDFSPSVHSPKKVPGLPFKAVDISCGGFFTLVLAENGQVFAMGKEDFGCLGTNSDPNSMSIGCEKPTLVSTLRNKPIRAIHAAGWHSLFITQENELFVVGKGEYGRLGLGDEASRTAPVRLAENVLQARGGGAHSIWCDDKRQIFATGRLDGGRCGLGPLTGDRVKTARNITAHFLPGFSEIVQVEAGGSHSALLLEYPHITSAEQVPAFFAEFDGFKAAMSAKNA